MSDYHINIFFSEEDGGYIVNIPDQAGKQIPARYRPAIYHTTEAYRLWADTVGLGVLTDAPECDATKGS